MNASNMEEYYNYAFQLLEYAKGLEAQGNMTEAVEKGYRPACEQFRELFRVEPDAAKKDLLCQQVTFFEDKVQQYYQQQQQQQQQQHHSTQPRPHSQPFPRQHATPQSTPAPRNATPTSVHVHDNNNVVQLRNRADSAYNQAKQLDTGPTATGSPNNTTRAETLYLEAADLYMQASKICSPTPLGQQLQKSLAVTISSILDRVTQLRGVGNEQKKSIPATSVDGDSFFEEFDKTLPTVDPFRPLVGKGNSNGPTKKPSGPPSSNASINMNTPPQHKARNSGDLTNAEIAILRRSSYINGRCFLPWLNDENTEQFRYPAGKRFTDPDGFLPLSASQKSKQARYKRIDEIVASSAASMPGEKLHPVLIKTVSPLAITQDLVADCSFVCSLCISAAFEARFKRKLITSIIYPQNEKGVPIYNPSGKYLVKLFMNGIMRKVVVDDYLPVATHVNSKGNEVYRLLCSCSSDPSEMWISLIEKAYMKLNGGYDFPGSNSGIDLHALTGWLPEQVFFVEDKHSFSDVAAVNKPLDSHQLEDVVWDRISSAHKYGDCLITISTSNKLTKDEEEATGLVPGHAYAVLNVVAAGNLRMLQVKNPWARHSWKGRFSSRDRDRWTPGLKQALGVSDNDFDRMDSHGIFWIDFTDCRQYFQSFFLNWNSALFVFRTTVHGLWPVAMGPKMDTYYVGANPQYSLIVHGSCNSAGTSNPNGVGTSIWLLLSRHVVTKDIDPDSVSSEAGASLRDDDTYLTMHIYRDGQRIFASMKPMIKGIYSSDPHVLSRIDISSLESKEAQADISLEFPHGKPIEYTIVLSQSEKLRDVYYTISAYSTALPFSLKPCPQLPSNQMTVTGAWKSGVTAGGNTNSRLFHTNPQYKLHIPPVVRGGIDIHIHAMYSKDVSGSISVVDVFKNNASKGKNTTESNREGERVNSYARIDCIANDEAEVLTSGSYRGGYCMCSTKLRGRAEAKEKSTKGRKQSKPFHLEAGDYTVVLSAYTTESVGNFALTVATTAGSVEDTSGGTAIIKPRHVKKYFTLNEIVPEGHGLKHLVVNSAWSDEDRTAAGCTNFNSYHLNPIFLLHLPQDAVLCIRLNTAVNGGAVGAGLNISVYDISMSAHQNHSTTDQDPLPPPPDLTHTECSNAIKNMSGTPREALLTSNDGVYVVRGTGAFIAPAVLKSGTYAIIPSTFNPTSCKFIMDVYVTPSVAKHEVFKFFKTT